MSNVPTNEEKLDFVSKRLVEQKARISAVLPDGVSFVEFHTAFVTACRKTPDVWKCTPESIFDAAIDSAIDGLPCDGKHAAIVARVINIGSQSAKNFITVATYMPMALGIRKKIIETGAALSIETTVVYANEDCVIRRGTNPSIEHEVMTEGERGEWIGVYSVAVLPNNQTVFEYMTREDVMDVREAAQTKKIWDKHETEMARKTVLRRHSKALPGSQMMVDIEQQRLIAMIERKYEPKAVGSTPRPTRQAPAAIEDQSNAMPVNDFSSRQGETVEHQEQRGEPEKEKASGSTEKAAQVKQDTETEPVDQDLPQSQSEFDLWALDIKAKIAKLTSADEVNKLRRFNSAITAAAPEDIREEVDAAFVAHLSDLA